MIKCPYKKGVYYMQVSAILSNYCQTVSNAGVNSKGSDYYSETAFNSLNSRKNTNDKQNKMFDAINEWKNFCHSQIEKGKFDVIA